MCTGAGVSFAEDASGRLRPPIESLPLEQAIKEAKAQLEADKLDAAEESFNAILKRFPDNAETLFYLGVIYTRKNQPREGLEYMRKSAALAPNNMRVRASLATIYETLNMLEEASRQYKAIMSQAPGTAEAKEAEKNLYLLQIRQYAEGGEADAALALAAILRRDYSNDPRVLHAIGLTFLNFNRVTDAEGTFKRIVELVPGSAVPHFYLARVYARGGKMALAIEEFKKAAALEPGNAIGSRAAIELGLIRGVQYLEQKELTLALKEFQAVLAIDPTVQMALFNAAHINRELKNWDEAEAGFKKLLEIEPRHLDARLRLAAIYLDRNQLIEASRELERVVAIGPGTPPAQQAAVFLKDLQEKYGERLTEARKVADEVERYKAEIKADPDKADAHFNLGVLYVKQSLTDAALQEFKETVRLNPGDATAHFYAGLIQDEKALLSEAVDSYLKAISLETKAEQLPKIIERLRIAVARGNMAQGRFTLAAGDLDVVLAENPKEMNALFYRAIVHASRGELGEAERVYRRLIEMSPGNLSARNNLAMLYEATNREEDAIKEYRYIIQNGGTSSLVVTAEKKIPVLESRIGGFTYNMGYSMTYDSNTNFLDKFAIDDFLSNLSVNMAYRHKISRNVRAALFFAPGYLIYHNVQSDFTRFDTAPSITLGPGDKNITLGASRLEVSNLTTETNLSTTTSYSSDVFWRFDMPALLRWFAQPAEKEKAPTILRFSFSYRDLFSPSSGRLLDSRAYLAGLSFSQGLGLGRALTMNYDYIDSTNQVENPVARDFAYQGHTATLRFEKSFTPQWTASAAYTFAMSFYKNPDVRYFVETRGERQRRVNMMNSLSFVTNYQVNDKLRVYGTFSYQLQDSSLPPPLINPGVFGAISNVLNPGIGDYHKLQAGLGMTLIF
ncbi:MAG: tetratricopeptide repeat protein [Gammaproteobacteria bacterium]|nr:tetratricopeptide repeat protein [Gammaproteobacteria bacterium]